MRPVTVLGASGFLGCAVTAALATRPIRLRVVARRPAPVPDDARAEVEIRTADLSDPHQLSDAVADSAAVLNLLKHSGDWRSADTDPAAERVNVATMSALTAAFAAHPPAAGPPPLCLFAGTVSQVGLPPDRPMDGTEPDHPRTAYDRQKLTAEQTLKTATAAGVVRGISLRLPTVYGHAPAGAPDVGVVATMTRRALAGQPLTIWNDGAVKRELIHLQDVVEAFLAALDRPHPLIGRHWLIGTGDARELADIFATIARSVAAHTGQPPVPVVSTTPPSHAAATDFRSVMIDPLPYRTAAGWSARIPLHEGIDHTVATLADQPPHRTR